MNACIEKAMGEAKGLAAMCFFGNRVPPEVLMNWAGLFATPVFLGFNSINKKFMNGIVPDS